MQIQGYEVKFRRVKGKPMFRVMIAGAMGTPNDCIGHLRRFFNKQGEEKWVGSISDYLGGEYTKNYDDTEPAIIEMVEIYKRRQQAMK